ncbi:hypothetical protein RHOFW510R12_00625 [Rhodanobacter sp. FW510-R12]
MQHETVGSVRIGSEWVSIKRRGTSAVDTARILGRAGEGDDEVIYLDRILHRHDGEAYAEGWRACGAMVTQLFRAR